MEIPPELQKKMDRLLIHGENVQRAIFQAQQERAMLYQPQNDCYICHLLQGTLTYWVVFRPLEGGGLRF